jgi:hypothetical protein
MINVGKKATRLFSDPDELSGVNENFGKVPEYIKGYNRERRNQERENYELYLLS